MDRPQKRKNSIPNGNKVKKQRKPKKKSIPKPSTSGLLRKNSFDALSNLNDKEVVLLDSDNDSDSLVLGDSVADTPTNASATPEVKNNQDIKDNADFIGFDFSDSDSDPDHSNNEPAYEYDNFDEDNEYLSNDDADGAMTYRRSPRPKLNPEFPWLQNHDHSSKIEIVDWLNLEIKDFVNYISPSREEIHMRNEVFKKIKYLIITQLWSDCDVQVFGSFATDLYLPGSDIDLVITSPSGKYDTRLHLYQLSAFLRRTGLGINIETIAKAKVPIIKFVEPDSGIHIDVSFERTNGLTALTNIRNWLTTTPGLRELVLIIKQFLLIRRLNDVHVGGLGGYSIICLAYSFLKLHPRLSTNSIDPMENLGILLIEFFELYGLNFGYDTVLILFDPHTKLPIYISKRLYPELMMKNSFAILIRDPDDTSNNISKGSFNIRDIKRSFGGAFQLLSNKCYELNAASYKTRLNQSILGGVIKYKGKERDFNDARNDVTNEAMLPTDNDYDDDLPPLPTKLNQKKKPVVQEVQRSENDIHYYSEYSSDDDSTLLNIINESQDTTKPVVYDDKQKLINALFGIKSDESDHGELQLDNYENAEDEEEQAKVEKNVKRDYWNQKGGL